MSRSIGNCIADSLELCLGYTERLLTDIPEDSFARFATVGGVSVESNHPAFILGHLSLYARRILDQLGQDSSSIVPTDRFEEAFNPSAKCEDDVSGTIYPSKEEITTAYFNGYRAALEALRTADDAQFQGENPAEGRLKELFPSIGSMHSFYAGGHIMMHLGQLSAWRRMQGMGAA